jgi:hypothetical protein
MTASTSSDLCAFVSFSSSDREKAKRLCDDVERAGLRCWISLRDVAPGRNYQAEIVHAIETAQVTILLFSAAANASEEVSKELSLASAFKRTVIPFRIEDVMPQGAFLYELATRQWIDAFTGWEPAVGQLVSAIRHAAGSETPPSQAAGPGPAAPPATAAPAPAAVAAPAPPRIPEHAMEAARVALTPYVGPIARVLVRRAAAEAASLDDLHERLAAQIPSVAEQEAFRRRVRGNSRR